MRNAIRFGLGVVTMVTAVATQRFWDLVDRGIAVRPTDPGLAGSIDRLVTIRLPTAVGSVLGTALDSSIDGLEQLRGTAGAAQRELLHIAGLVLRRAGVPTRADVDTVRRRLEEAAAALDRFAHAEPTPHD
jgi:hypothetical protein